MKISMQQSIGIRQELRMNPRLYQAMDLLYMPLLDLQQHLKTELEVNPFLEMAEPDVEEPVEPEQEKAEEESDDETDWEAILLDGFSVGGAREQFEVREHYEPVAVEYQDIGDHIRDQLQLQTLTDRQYFLSEELIGSIGDDGYLQVTLEEIVAGANERREELVQRMSDGDGIAELADPFDESEVEAVLRIVQRLDPAGLGARDLRECLLLQLEDNGDTDTLTYRLVRDDFDDLLGHRWNDLAKRYEFDPKTIQDAADELARLDPKPGLRFTRVDQQYVVPDLVVEKMDDEYRIYLNDSGVPRLRISQIYRDIAGDKKKFVGKNREFITEKLNSATWLVQAIEQRRQTMLKVMHFIVDRQREFFEKGVEYLRPLTLREVAEVVDMHESTVSRVTSQKYVQTPRGVFPLKFFFSSSLGTTTGEDASSRAVKAQIQKLVSDEDAGKPLTDAAIVNALKRKGIQIARRTVAKYRDQLGVLPARMRKRV